VIVHLGRQLEGAPSSVETLLEIRKYEPWVFKKVEVWADGGVRRGTDVLKLLALGANAVGIGRPCKLELFANSLSRVKADYVSQLSVMYSLVFGDEGVNQVATILRDELAQNVRLVGATKLSELSSALVNTKELERNMYDGPYESPVKTILAKL